MRIPNICENTGLWPKSYMWKYWIISQVICETIGLQKSYVKIWDCWRIPNIWNPSSIQVTPCNNLSKVSLFHDSCGKRSLLSPKTRGQRHISQILGITKLHDEVTRYPPVNIQKIKETQRFPEEMVYNNCGFSMAMWDCHAEGSAGQIRKIWG